MSGFVQIRRGEKVIARGSGVTWFRIHRIGEVIYFVGWYQGALRLNFWLYLET